MLLIDSIMGKLGAHPAVVNRPPAVQALLREMVEGTLHNLRVSFVLPASLHNIFLCNLTFARVCKYERFVERAIQAEELKPLEGMVMGAVYAYYPDDQIEEYDRRLRDLPGFLALQGMGEATFLIHVLGMTQENCAQFLAGELTLEHLFLRQPELIFMPKG